MDGLAESMRHVLRDFYGVLKGCDEYLRFVLLTGISQFGEVDVFTVMNNLQDISMLERYGDIMGYTQEELEVCFSDWLDDAAERRGTTRSALLDRAATYSDDFCFDGMTRMYHPLAVLKFCKTAEFSGFDLEARTVAG